MQGDRVSFRLFTERRSGRQGATAVRLVQAGGERECGVVVSVKESYGFLKCADRDYKQMFFHFSELGTNLISVCSEQYQKYVDITIAGVAFAAFSFRTIGNSCVFVYLDSLRSLFILFTVDPDAQLQPGVELEFSIALNKKGQLHATRGKYFFHIIHFNSIISPLQ